SGLWRSGLASGRGNLRRGVRTERLLRAKTATPKARSSRGPRPAPAKLASAASTPGSRAMEVLQSSPLAATWWGGPTKSGAQDVGQFFGLTIFYGIDKDSSSRTFCDHVDSV